ncbi:MAG: hypothetical protein GC191_09025 [Azospirillum sp.]|nr:hypothetical protein [Azospirillum sp.]
MIASAPTDLERRVITAAVLWVNDQGCSQALASLEDAVADYLTARAAARNQSSRYLEGDQSP